MPFDLNLGNFNSNDTFSLDYVGFFLASIVNVIVMLSLLISILGDSFDRFMLEAVEIDHIEMAEVVYDMELLYFFNKQDARSEFMQICDTLKSSYSIVDWEGSARAIEQNVTKSFEKRLKPIQMSLDMQNGSLNAKLQGLERLVAENIRKNDMKMRQLDQKLDQIITRLNK